MNNFFEYWREYSLCNTKVSKKKKNSLLTLMMITAQVARELESIYCLKLLRSASLDISKSPSFVGQDTNHLITQVFAAC